MGFIRNRNEIRTGYQEKEEWAPELDLQCDFVMAYGLNDTLKQRIDSFRRQGYEVHLMTGCAWGSYEDYLNGAWDKKEHWDECQTDRNGEKIMHGVNVPYMVPTMEFADYLAKKLCGLVDYGISAIHMEEPEFWDAGGYSPAFQREYESYYKEKWQPPHESVTAMYRCARLKAWLYARLIDHLSRYVKEYAREKLGREIAFYVAMHSQVNYTQWKILSPGSTMAQMDGVDGFIAQVWSGTSGTGNVYGGRYRSRTFETAYLEYGSMQELISGTEKKMWFLHDPVEDFPENGWDVYRKKYIKTVTASLFWQKVDRYEVCPWPNRVINGRYPKKLGMAEGMVPTEDMEGARNIPREYATMLSGMIQTLGNMEQEESRFLGNKIPVGILISDTSMYQRSFPDTVRLPGEAGGEREIALKGQEARINDQVLSRRESEAEEALYKELLPSEEEAFYGYQAGCTYPNFFGLAMPLLKNGLPIRPVYLEHMRHRENYLSAYRYLILSYEYMKPLDADYNRMLAEWVQNGGCLIYVGDGSDPYHKVRAWWNEEEACENPAQQLFRLLHVDPKCADGTYLIGKGRLAVYREAPARLTFGESHAERYRRFVKNVLFDNGYVWRETNCLAMQRGPYLVAASMDESSRADSYEAEGTYTDLLADGFPVIHGVCVETGTEGLFYDYEKIEKETCCIVATAARIEEMECGGDKLTIVAKAADRIHVYIRVRLPWRPGSVTAETEDNVFVPIGCDWDEETRTALFSYDSADKRVVITGLKSGC